MRQTKQYLVEWDFDVELPDGGTPRDAAMEALAAQRNPESSATVFKVTEKRTGDVTIIDLDEQPAVAYDEDFPRRTCPDPVLVWLASPEARRHENHWVALNPRTGKFLGMADALPSLRMWQARNAMVLYVDPLPENWAGENEPTDIAERERSRGLWVWNSE